MNPFDDEDKIYMTFELRGHGKEHIIRCEYDDDIHWSELVSDVVKQIEATWGYSLDFEGDIGIYYKGKSNND